MLAWSFVTLGEYDEALRITDDVAYMVDFAEGRIDDAIERTRDKALQDPHNEPAIVEAAGVLFYAGQIKEALPLYERLRDFKPEGRPIGVEPFQAETTMRLAVARRRAGDEKGALVAAQIAKSDLDRLRATGQDNQLVQRALAMVAAFENDPQRSILAIESALNKGLRFPFFLDDPTFEILRDEPRFLELRQELARLLDEEHEKVLQLICIDNPVPDSWRPLPQTCEKLTVHRSP